MSGETRDSPRSLFLRFLRFGALAWGGPAAQIQMVSRECVDHERWVDPDTFRKTLAVYQALPGPEAHQLCVYFGHRRGGRLGGLLAGLGFMLPGFLLMLGLSVLYVRAGLDERFEELFYGLKAAVGGLVAIAILRLGRRFVTDAALAVVALAALAVALTGAVALPLILLAAGLAYGAARGLDGGGRGTGEGGREPRALRALTPAPLVLLMAGTVTVGLTAAIFLEGLRAGLLTFGGAYTAIPFLQEGAVEREGWLTQEQFLDGLAISGVLPAPLIIFSTYVGYLAGGLGGSLAMTVGVFLPAFVLPIFFHRPLLRLADSPRLRPFLLGVAAGAVGLIAAVTVGIVRTSVVDVPSAGLAVGAFLTLHRFHGKLTVLFVVLGCGAIGALLQLTVL
jgi:chromate transporter